MSQHARLSPSGSKKWMSCPGSLVLEADYPNTASVYSDEGTACHEIAARCLTDHKPVLKYVGEYVVVSSPGEEERKVLFTEDMADLVQTYINNFLVHTIGNEYWVEQRVDFSSYVGEPGQFGTADGVILYMNRENRQELELQVHDAKFGRTPVKVENNSQLMLYALGVIHELTKGSLMSKKEEPKDDDLF